MTRIIKCVVSFVPTPLAHTGQRNVYHEAQRESAAFRGRFTRYLLALDDPEQEMLSEKVQLLAVSELDAALRLKDWDHAKATIAKCSESDHGSSLSLSRDEKSTEDRVLAMCADVVLKAEVPKDSKSRSPLQAF
jgi:hypothetical protein